MTTTKKITVKVIKERISAEYHRIGYRALTSLPPETIPEGKVAVHIPLRARSWVQFLTDEIEPCACGWQMLGPKHYRVKEGVDRRARFHLVHKD
jgi:hypothetical protein